MPKQRSKMLYMKAVPYYMLMSSQIKTTTVRSLSISRTMLPVTKKLLEVIKHEYEQGSSTIVFACSVEHARKLAILLSFEGITAYSIDSVQDDSVSRAYKISEYKKKNVQVLINYGILTAGFDAPVTNVAIIARPTDSLVAIFTDGRPGYEGNKEQGEQRMHDLHRER